MSVVDPALWWEQYLAENTKAHQLQAQRLALRAVMVALFALVLLGVAGVAVSWWMVMPGGLVFLCLSLGALGLALSVGAGLLGLWPAGAEVGALQPVMGGYQHPEKREEYQQFLSQHYDLGMEDWLMDAGRGALRLQLVRQLAESKRALIFQTACLRLALVLVLMGLGFLLLAAAILQWGGWLLLGLLPVAWWLRPQIHFEG